MLILMFCLSMLDAEWRTTDTGVFQPLKVSEVVVRPDGAFYVRNFNDSQIRLFGADGELVKTIGRKGKGPGEFTYPSNIFYDNGRLYVFDILTVKINAFDKEGEFIEAVTAPNRGLDLHYTPNGWIFGNWNEFGLQDKSELAWADLNFENQETLMKMEDGGFSQGSRVVSDGSTTVAEYAPIDNQPMVRVSPDGSRIYLTSIESFKITVFDSKTRKVVNTIQRDEPRIPFDEDWAEEKYKEMMEGRRNRDQVKFKKLFPEYFPPFRNLIVSYDGTLIVDRWRGRPDDNHYPLALTPEGKEIQMKHKYETYQRIAGVQGDAAYVLIFNTDDEEAGVARCSLKEVDEFVAANPIEFEGSAGYSISISN